MKIFNYIVVGLNLVAAIFVGGRFAVTKDWYYAILSIINVIIALWNLEAIIDDK